MHSRKYLFGIYTLKTKRLEPNRKVAPPIIKTHGSESRGQEEAGLRDEPVSYLQVAPL